MLQVTPHMRILVAIDRVDGRKGIDSLAQHCRAKLSEDPFSGCLFLFLNQRGTTLKALCYDGAGFWMCQKRLSKGTFPWPKGANISQGLEAHQAYLLFAAGNPATLGAPVWRRVEQRPPQGARSCK